MAESIDNLRQVRLEKLKKIESLGIVAYPPKYEKKNTVSEARNSLGKQVRTAGRLLSFRQHGKATFADLSDETGKIQLLFRLNTLEEHKYKFLDLLDIGDFLGVSGPVITTEAGEITISVENFELLSKSIRPLPSQWYGLKDVEEKYRKRYLDLIINEQVKKNLDTRWLLERKIREFLWSKNFKEVETPVLQNLYGGTNAKPFTTHLNALDQEMFLRVAPELYLKRLIVGGYEKVFEIARNFRNEGMDHAHQPEFTMLEWYEAYADYHDVMNLVESMMKFLASEILQTTVIPVKGQQIEIGNSWPKKTVRELLKEHLKIDSKLITDAETREVLLKHKVEIPGEWSKNKALYLLFDKVIAPTLTGPIWVIDLPREVSPLSRQHRDDDALVERFNGFLGGDEIFDGWSEVVSGIDQRQRFEVEQKNMRAGDDETQPLDEEFIEALEFGCPPLGGIGFGIDRLAMLFTNTESIREIIAFPLLRPERGSTSSNDPKLTKKAVKNGPPLTFSREAALKLVREKLKNENLVRHSLSVEAVMRSLANHFGGDEEKWGILGLLHDSDYEETKEDIEKHTLLTIGWLKDHGETDPELIRALQSHNAERTGFPGPDGLMEWSLFCCDELTGLIVATTLMQPTKKLADTTTDSVMRKWTKKGFAAGAKREDIEQCVERLGIPVEQFVGIALSAMQKIAPEIGL
jgi:lysyl-tRNA synthetase class 2